MCVLDAIPVLDVVIDVVACCRDGEHGLGGEEGVASICHWIVDSDSKNRLAHILGGGPHDDDGVGDPPCAPTLH